LGEGDGASEGERVPAGQRWRMAGSHSPARIRWGMARRICSDLYCGIIIKHVTDIFRRRGKAVARVQLAAAQGAVVAAAAAVAEAAEATARAELQEADGAAIPEQCRQNPYGLCRV